MPIDALAAAHAARRLPSRIWRRDHTAFGELPPDAQTSIGNRLGWLDAPDGMAAQIGRLNEFVAGVRADGLTDVYLLGMGGSSLCAEVLRDVSMARREPLRLTVLDTTDECAIREATEALEPSRALFIVASKSGSTVEVASLQRYFWALLADVPARRNHFVAITDPDTGLFVQARTLGYREIFVNPPDIGGRYSALSLFGLVPAALCGIDVSGLLQSARAMADACRTDDASNPGLALGTFMGGHAANGRDKLTLLVGPSLDPLGVWIEQLVAESTGKDGKGVLPVVGEAVGGPSDYGPDRAFVAIVTPDGSEIRTAARALQDAGHPVLTIETSAEHLGAEFFRWEFATAVAGGVLGVNPFDEPNVRQAKVFTQAQLDRRKARGAFTLDPPLERGPGHARRVHERTGDGSGGRYLAILDYLPADARRDVDIGRLRATVRQRAGIATTHGIGPRYLHSTGQYHKGGPNTGVFLLVTATDASATPVPDTDYTFATLKHAQALGDFDALAAAGREVVHYHIEDATADVGEELERVALSLKYR